MTSLLHNTVPAWFNYCDFTGSFTRVGVMVDDEEEAMTLAEEYMSYKCAWTSQEPWGWEIVFDTGDAA